MRILAALVWLSSVRLALASSPPRSCSTFSLTPLTASRQTLVCLYHCSFLYSSCCLASSADAVHCTVA
eukprot:6181090-Pleurochrysis_carterae.AAC.5